MKIKNKLDILFEDEEVLVVNKAPDMLTLPHRFFADRPNLLTKLTESRGKIFVVHRIDRETSGIICFAKTKEAHRNLSMQFEKRTVDKYYLALLEGSMYKEEGRIDKAIRENKVTRGKMIVAANGKEALTLYKVMERFKHFTLVEANIKTGRMHQIRIHFQSIGYPLAVDSLYGRQAEFFLSSIKRKKYRKGKGVEERPLMSRTTLHAERLSFDHPVSGKRIEIQADLPKDFNAMLKQLRKWGM